MSYCYQESACITVEIFLVVKLLLEDSAMTPFYFRLKMLATSWWRYVLGPPQYL